MKPDIDRAGVGEAIPPRRPFIKPCKCRQFGTRVETRTGRRVSCLGTGQVTGTVGTSGKERIVCEVSSQVTQHIGDASLNTAMAERPLGIGNTKRNSIPPDD